MKTTMTAGLFGTIAGLAALLGGCGGAPGADGGDGVGTEQAAVTSAATLAAGAACHVNGESCGTGLYCALTETSGVCSTAGVCTARPTLCSQAAPLGGVCGCDGKDYVNDCYAERAGASVAHPGPCSCSPTADGDATETCASGFTCKTTVSSRGVCGQAGTCVATDACPKYCVQESYCGCDGKTYDGCNECLDVVAAGVEMAYAGACR
jgi:hypothetical protein